jgi:hypothetical protein
LNVITLSGPYLTGSINPETEKAEVQMNRSFRILFKRCQQRNARFSVAYITLKMGERIGHANILIIDNSERIIERYDPNGAVSYNQETDLMLSEKALLTKSITNEIDRSLDQFAKEMGYLYVFP